jgi:hypothetical protein
VVVSLDMMIRLLNRVAPNGVEETAQSPSTSALKAKIRQFRRFLSGDLGCDHDLVYDDIGDVYCKRCGKDFTD